MIPTWGYIPGSRKYSHVIIIVVITIIILIHQSFILRPKYRTHLNFLGTAQKDIFAFIIFKYWGWFRAMPQPRRNPKYTEDHGPSTLRHIQQSKTYPESSRVNKHCNKEINRTCTVEKMVPWFTKELIQVILTNLHFVLLGRAFLQISNPSGHKIQPEMVIYFQTNPIPYWFYVVQTISFSGVQSARGLWQFVQSSGFASHHYKWCSNPVTFPGQLEIRDVVSTMKPKPSHNNSWHITTAFIHSPNLISA